MNEQIILTLLSGIFISGVAAYLGTLMLSKKMSIVAGPLAHLAFPGVAIALVFGFNISLGVFPFVIIGAFLMWILEKKTELPLENLAAIVFASGVGSALIFLPLDEAEAALIGNIGNISMVETIFIIALSVSVFFVIKYIYNKIMLMNVDEDLASVEGINVDRYNLVYLLSIAVVVALGVYLVGALITAALIALPAASAKNTSKDIASYKMEAILYGVLATVIGVALGIATALPVGPLIIIAGTILFLFSIVIMHLRSR